MKTDASGKTTILQCRSQPTVDPCPSLGLILDQGTGACRPLKKVDGGYARSSNYAGRWGSWGNWDKCDSGYLVCGIQTRVEDRQGGGDDTALNAVRLICCHNSQSGRTNVQEIFSKQGGWGTWGREAFCPINSYANGISMKFEPRQGGGDDTSTNAVRLRCSDPAKTVLISKEGIWGSFDNWGTCPIDEHICGVRTRVEDGQGSGDDTAFNGIETRCCKTTE